LLNVEERRGYQALVAVGSLLGMVAAAILLSIVDWDVLTDALVIVGCTVLGGLVTWPLARRESRVWERRRRERDSA
jgi:hypothetical protein